MTDSVQIFPPGFRIPDTAGNPLPGALVYFYDAGTTTPKTVYSDSGLTATLGTVVTADSAGYPTASSVRVIIYTGTAAYKIVCTDTNGVQQWSHDNVRGAIDTSTFITTTSTTITYTVTPVTTAGTWAVADVTGRVFEANPSGGNFTRTLPAASTATGVPFDVAHSGASGIVTLLTQGADLMLIDGSDTARKALLLVAKGESVRFVSNGVNWRAFFLSQVERALAFAVEDLRTAPAGSPVVGGYYLLNGAPSGAFTSTSPACAANDIVMYDGQSNYQIFRPSTDCGWTAYDKATNTHYQFQGSAWVALNDMLTYATQTEVEAHTATNRPVTPATMHHHDGVAKAWVSFAGASGTISTDGSADTIGSYNVSSVTRGGTGAYTINFTTAFSSTAYVPTLAAQLAGFVNVGYLVGTMNTTSMVLTTYSMAAGGAAAAADPTKVMCSFFGDQ